MHRRSRHAAANWPDLTFVLLALLLGILWIAGGASRADVLGQTVVRASAWLAVMVALVFAARPRWHSMVPLAWFLASAILLVALQLIPLPPSLWTALPGREMLAGSALVSGQPQPWRPLSLSPDATLNALSALVVPAVVLYLLGLQRHEDRWWLVRLLLGFVVASSLLGLMQFSGSGFDHPLINDVGSVSANFANRNHFALFAACGCILAPAWAFGERRYATWKAILAAGLLIFFVLIILATGSRSGIVLGAVGVAIGLTSVGGRILKQLRAFPRRVWLPTVLSAAGALIIAVVLSITLGRAASVERVQLLDAAADLRAQSLPTVIEMVGSYWPAGSGYGTFDPAYRIIEPSALLSYSYLNHAHNDLLEVVLDGGIAGLSILLAALIWVAWSAFRAWRTPIDSGSLLPRVGSGIILLVVLASAVDYPARTPMIMALLVIGAFWLGMKRDRNYGTNTAR